MTPIGSDGHMTWCPVPYPDDHEWTCLDQLLKQTYERLGWGEYAPTYESSEEGRVGNHGERSGANTEKQDRGPSSGQI